MKTYAIAHMSFDGELGLEFQAGQDPLDALKAYMRDYAADQPEFLKDIEAWQSLEQAEEYMLRADQAIIVKELP